MVVRGTSPSECAPSDVPSEYGSEWASVIFSSEVPVGSAKNASCRWIDLRLKTNSNLCMIVTQLGGK